MEDADRIIMVAANEMNPAAGPPGSCSLTSQPCASLVILGPPPLGTADGTVPPGRDAGITRSG